MLLAAPILLNFALIWATTAASVSLSFTSYNGVTAIEWIGTRNYEQIVTIYEPFWGAVRNNLLWLAVLGVIATPLGLFFAFLLNKQIRFSRFYQSVFYMPVVLSLAVVGFIAQLVYSRDHGALNVLLLGNAEHRYTPPTGSATRTSTSGRCWSRPSGGTPGT
ncbi:hypothetical protein AB0H83_46705 [Dactylosporangium sp. NPDC050688]|uniref:carbohydrate ABC transporter permease n=1 Tax=Dactylosporangium sp. NPDC050688 TaxID=3157217 RepID=UPI0033CF751E